MQEIITSAQGAAIVTAAAAVAITGKMFSDFVSFIDRSENTTRAYLINLRQFMAWMKYTGTQYPQREDIISYRDWLGAQHEAIEYNALVVDGWTYRTDKAGNRQMIVCKPNTIAQYLRSVQQFFRWTAANNLYPDIAANVHAPKLDHQHHKKDALTAAQVQTIEKSIDTAAQRKTAAASCADKDRDGRTQRSEEQGKRLRAMYLLAVNAGLRTIEISRANIKDIETKGGASCIYIWGKGHTEADTRKPIAPEVKAAIDEYLQTRTDKPTGSSPLFVSTGNRSFGKRIAPTTISTMLKRAMQEAGFDSERITAHTLRHTAGNNVRKLTGNNIYETQKYMRHSNPATTEIYMHDGEEEAAQQMDIAQRLYNLYHGISAEETDKAQLIGLIEGMTAAQMQQLTGIARALRGA